MAQQIAIVATSRQEKKSGPASSNNTVVVPSSINKKLFELYLEYCKQTHYGKINEGVQALLASIGRMLFFGKSARGNKIRLENRYSCPSWARALKAIPGAKGRCWRGIWLPDGGDEPIKTFYNNKIPDLVSRNITPGREPEEYLPRPLVRVNRAQRKGLWTSNLFRLSPEFLEWLACHKEVSTAEINWLIGFIRLNHEPLEFELPELPQKAEENRSQVEEFKEEGVLEEELEARPVSVAPQSPPPPGGERAG